MAETEPQLTPEAQERAFTHLFELFIKTELDTRLADGWLGEDFELNAAQVLLAPGGPNIGAIEELLDPAQAVPFEHEDVRQLHLHGEPTVSTVACETNPGEHAITVRPQLKWLDASG